MPGEKAEQVEIIGQLQGAGLLLIVGTEYAEGENGIGLVQFLAGQEMLFIQTDQPRIRLGIDKQAQVIGQAPLGGQHRAVRAGAQHPQGNIFRWPGADQRLRLLLPQVVTELCHQFREFLEFWSPVGGQGHRGGHICPWGAAHTQVHPARVEVGQQGKYLGDLVGAVVG